MSDTTTTPATGQELINFLTWTIDKNELVESTASALRTGSQKVLSVDDNWASINLETEDIDGFLQRFRNKYRTEMKERTLLQYEQRFRQSLDMFLKWRQGQPWKLQRTTSQRTQASTRQEPKVRQVTDAPTTGGSVTSSTEVNTAEKILYPFPIRPGLIIKLELPTDMTSDEAKRVAAYIATLAMPSSSNTDIEK